MGTRKILRDKEAYHTDLCCNVDIKISRKGFKEEELYFGHIKLRPGAGTLIIFSCLMTVNAQNCEWHGT